MEHIVTNVINSIRTDGIIRTVYRCLRYPFNRIKSLRDRKNIFRSSDTGKIFSEIYKINWWGNEESVSGHGSTLYYTENLRKELPLIFKKYSINTVFDAPCGDFNWMIKVVASTGINYIGGDIVPQIINKNRETHEKHRANFQLLDLITDEYPDADIWICRDFMIHLSFKDIYQSLEKYIKSGIPYILATTHINSSGFINTDIKTGDARVIDLFSAPFYFPKEPLVTIKDWVKPHPPRVMVLFRREQVIRALDKMKQDIRLNGV